MKATSFADGDVFVIGSDNDHCVWSFFHIADTLEVAEEFKAFAVKGCQFFFGHGLELGAFFNAFQPAEAFYALADGGNVGQCAT